jgi:NDP-sugar pyrophosphorylase family protein/aminoglycoside/choline kinase family phosphotransferase
MKPFNVFILAAGFGERLKPVTDHIPKPLLPILGRPVIEKVIDTISTLQPAKIGINMHYKWEMLRDWAGRSAFSEKITLFFESTLLGTGGALRNAESFLKGSAFLVCNSDIVTDIDLSQLIEKHFASGNLATLAVHSRREFNNVWIDHKGNVQFVGEKSHDIRGLRPVAFTGIAVYSPRFLDVLPEGPSHIVASWLRASSSGASIGTEDFTGCLWTDIGSPETYSAFVFDTLKREGEVIYVHPSVDTPLIEMGNNTVIEEGCRIVGAASLRNCIALPGAVIGPNAIIENAIVGPDYLVGIPQSMTIPASLSSSLLSGFLRSSAGETEMTLIGTGGSDRRYYRIRDNGKSAVLMECPGGDPDFQRHLIYTEFFRKWAFPVPELLGTDTGSGTPPALMNQGCMYALFEDLGDLSLYSWLKSGKGPDRVETMYRKVIETLVHLHTEVTRNISDCLLLKSRVFDRDHLRWESSYFMDRFVVALREREIREKESLDIEFDRLARKVASFATTVIHRDFQSQNIMVTRGDIPRVIDYQGARMGPPAYDLASLLWDPYFSLEGALRTRLLDYYMEKRRNYDKAFDNEEFLETLLPCRLQRHMQALGAYGYLARVKGKEYFLKYVPRALEYLKEEAECVRKEYPVLAGIAEVLDKKTQD